MWSNIPFIKYMLKVTRRVKNFLTTERKPDLKNGTETIGLATALADKIILEFSILHITQYQTESRSRLALLIAKKNGI